MKWAVFGLALCGAGAGLSGARSVAVGGVVQAAAVDSRLLPGGEMLAVWTLPRLGVSVRNDPSDLRLMYGARELRYSPPDGQQAGGWQALGLRLTGPLAPPQSVNGSLYVPLAALKLLGIRTLDTASDVIDFAAPAVVPSVTLPPSTPAPPTSAPPTTPPPATSSSATSSSGVTLDTVRVSRTMHRGVEVQRVVLELSGPVPQTIARGKDGLDILLPGVSASAVSQTLGSGDSLSVTPNATGTIVHLGSSGGSSEIMTLDNPFRVVIDTTTLLDSSVPPPINPDHLPDGVTLWEKGALHLLSFDPARYQPRVVSAPAGHASDLAGLVRSVGGVGGVNGGYFDTSSALPVDLVVKAGLMVAPSLERRATVGFSASGQAMFGYPRPRYVLSGSFGTLTVNTVSAKPRPDLLSAFVGDGKTAVGADTLTTLYVSLNGSAVLSALSGRVTPPAGTLTLTFDPARFPQLPRAASLPLGVTLAWRADDAPWNTAQDALSAGPLLVSGGKVALNPQREMFNTGASIWRATRQVAVGNFGGKPTIAYFDYGTPESFAAALAGAGVSDAVRMDSGSSASAYLAQGYGTLGGYLNTVWSQNVPNAVVFVPRADMARKK